MFVVFAVCFVFRNCNNTQSNVFGYSFHPIKLFLSNNRLEIFINNPLFNQFFRRALAQRLVWRHHPKAVAVAKQKVEVVAAEKDGFAFLP